MRRWRNDTDPDGDTLSVTAITQPADGTAVLNADSTITYTPPPGFQGTALIPYTISDGHGGTDTATADSCSHSTIGANSPGICPRLFGRD